MPQLWTKMYQIDAYPTGTYTTEEQAERRSKPPSRPDSLLRALGKNKQYMQEAEALKGRLKSAGIEWTGSPDGKGKGGDRKDRKAMAIGAAAQTLSGGAAFAAVLALSQVFQGAVLRVSCSSPLGVPTMLGFTTVAAASVASLRVADGADRITKSYLSSKSFNLDEALPSLRHTATEPTASVDVGAGAFGLVLFRALGGRFNAVAPSVLHRPGAFSSRHASLPATLDYAGPNARKAMAAFGKCFGCHTCGTRVPWKYIADHIPPVKTAKLAQARGWRRLLRQTLSQRFYPQCESCSILQSTAVQTGKRTFRFHVGLHALRSHHATGGLLILASLMLSERRRQRQADGDDL